jgi:hypothetical protein
MVKSSTDVILYSCMSIQNANTFYDFTAYFATILRAKNNGIDILLLPTLYLNVWGYNKLQYTHAQYIYRC